MLGRLFIKKIKTGQIVFLPPGHSIASNKILSVKLLNTVSTRIAIGGQACFITWFTSINRLNIKYQTFMFLPLAKRKPKQILSALCILMKEIQFDKYLPSILISNEEVVRFLSHTNKLFHYPASYWICRNIATILWIRKNIFFINMFSSYNFFIIFIS